MANKNTQLKRVECRFDEDLRDDIDYYAKKVGLSRNEFIAESARYYIKYIQNDFDVPLAMVQRTNQLVDLVASLNGRLDSLEDTTKSGIQSIIQLTRGDNYLLDNDS